MAAPFQNYSGGVLLADIVKRNNLSTYVSEAIKERSLFIKSGAVVRNALLDAREGGTRIQVPEFNPVSPTEPNLHTTSRLLHACMALSHKQNHVLVFLCTGTPSASIPDAAKFDCPFSAVNLCFLARM